MKKLIIFLLISFVLAFIVMAGIGQAEEEREGDEAKEEGYKLTPEDKRVQIISILILVILVIAL
ncbi:hypothetical protein KAU86_01605 [bacterium]|nr:hypothetical protein [bacterium]MCK4325762.1 hypothetical protein [bacterium]MCK4436623.1 hypothetical protein [bacterium]